MHSVNFKINVWLIVKSYEFKEKNRKNKFFKKKYENQLLILRLLKKYYNNKNYNFNNT